MTGFRFIPRDWDLSDALYSWTKNKGLTDAQIEDQLERFKDHQYAKVRYDPDRCWRNWIRNGLDWGKIVPVQTPVYRKPEELTEEQREADRVKAWKRLNELKAAK